MPPINVKLKSNSVRSYPIVVKNGLLGQVAGRLKTHLKKPKPGQKHVIITDHHVKKLYGTKLQRQLEKAGLKTVLIAIPAGEKSKTLGQLEKITAEMVLKRVSRDDYVIALGGGVIGDMSGFAAAVYMRGLPFIQIPTTLLAMVDAAIGGKTGVNLKSGKNLIGCFHQPQMVLIDPKFLKTLPPKEFRNGMAEIIKHALIQDPVLFNYLEKNTRQILSHQPLALNKIIVQSCRIKARIVEKDEKENRLRMILNYGHTLGHALEKLSNYRLPHGDCVSIGIQLINQITTQKKLLPQTTTSRIEKLLQAYDLPTQPPKNISLKKLLQTAQTDKKVRANQINFVILRKIGQTQIVPQKKLGL